ncbi:hypothetical protein A6K26_007880 [Gammaproteobacteria bacterium 2W06]|nr:hypothetical protein A6K26_007880 [Gammaproteobacteria bacterium 2W06]
MADFNEHEAARAGHERTSIPRHRSPYTGTATAEPNDAYLGEPTGEQTWMGGPLRPLSGDFDESELGHHAESFESLLAEVRRLDPDDIAHIKDILRRTADLDELSVQTLMRAIKGKTGLPLKTLNSHRKCLVPNISASATSLAEECVREFWDDGILSCESGLYQWLDRGVWSALSAAAFRSYVQHFLKLKGRSVTKQVVEDVCYQIKNDVFVENHHFEQMSENVVNTLSGELTVDERGVHESPHIKGHYSITQIPVSYDPDADAPRFKAFLSEIFQGWDEQSKTQAVLEMMGYSLLRSTRLERFMILLGDGGNGKSVLINVLRRLCGDKNVAAVQPSELDRGFQRATLDGKLINVVTEVSMNTRLADGPIKAIVSGEGTAVEHKHRDPFVLRPYATCWFATNHLPKLLDNSNGIERRALILKFERSFPRNAAGTDLYLEEKLLEELPGILNLCLNAYSEALMRGFTTPISSHREMARWVGRDQSVELFLEARCRRASEEKTRTRSLYEAYLDWVKENDLPVACTERKFVDRLKSLGFGQGRSQNSRLIVGLSLNTRVDETGDVPVGD